MQYIADYLRREGYTTADASYYALINTWMQWYKGKVSRFHTYRQYNGKKHITRTRKSVGMAKRIPEDWANLLLNEKVEITAGDEATTESVREVLKNNQFGVRGNQLIELAFGLGTGAFVEFLDGDEVVIDYIRAGMIFPLRWDGGKITECAFGSESVEDKKHIVRLRIHVLESGQYVIHNRMFERRGKTLQPMDLPAEVEADVYTGTDVPYFQIVMPNIVNNVDLSCPMGISCFANAIDQMEGLDLIYDSYCNEFRLGRKRIMVPISFAKVQMEQNGTVKPVFDDNDTEFYAYTPAIGDKSADVKIQEMNGDLRHEAHEAALRTALNLLSAKCGMGSDRYDFEQGGVKTATEVISEKSDLFQNLKKHELLLNDALVALVKAILVLLGLSPDIEITVTFDDSIIEDSNAERQRFMQEVREGLRQKWEYRVKYCGETEAKAKEMTQVEGDDDTNPFSFKKGGDG